MIEAIQAELSRVEQIHGARILYAVESGSRVWGFDSPDSDWDVRFIYLRPLSWYLSVEDRRDVIEPPANGLLDLSGWDLKKALHLLGKSNPPMLEWLNSPTVYREDPLVQGLRQLSTDYFNPRSTIYHYLHMANGNYRQYLRDDQVPLKKYFYVLRPLLACEWVAQGKGLPPVKFDDLRTVADWNDSVHQNVCYLLGLKRMGAELGLHPRIDSVNAWIEAKLDHFSNLARTTAKGKTRTDDLDEFLVKALYSEIRSIA
jgi:predicted nucleotidyltransferase